MRCRAFVASYGTSRGGKTKALNVERRHVALVWCTIPKSVDMAMGWTMWAALSVENAACRDQTGDLFLLLLGWGAVAGGLGSLVRIRFLRSADLWRF